VSSCLPESSRKARREVPTQAAKRSLIPFGDTPVSKAGKSRCPLRLALTVSVSIGYRRKRIAEINAQPGSREALEAQHGQVWSTEGISRAFEAVGFMAPFVVVRRRCDGKKGSLEFQHNPQFDFNFLPHQ